MLNNLTMILPVVSVYMWGYVIYASLKEKVKAAFMPLFATAGIGLFLLLCGYINTLFIGTAIALALGLILFICCIVKKRNIFINYTKDYGIIAYLILCTTIIVVYTSKDMCYHIWDEISHWGPFFKSIFYTDALPMYSEYSMTHGSYTQYGPVLYYFFTFFLKEYNEPSAYAAVMIMMNASVVTMLYIVPRKRYILAVGVSIFAATFLAFFPQIYPYSTIYLDAWVGVMGGSVIIFMYSMDDKLSTKCGWILSAMLILAFALIKSSGLPIALLCVAFYFVCCSVSQTKKDKSEIISILWKTLLMLFVVVAIYVLGNKIFEWAGGMDITKVPDGPIMSFSERILECYYDWRMNGESSFWAKMAENFLIGLFDRKLGALPYIGWLIIMVVIIAISSVLKRVEKKDKIIIRVVPVSSLVLLTALLCVYMKRIYERALLLYSFERYITPIVIGSLMIMLIMLIKYICQMKKKTVGNIFSLTLFIICVINMHLNPAENYLTNQVTACDAYRERYQIISEELRNYVNEDSVVYMISQGNIGNVAFTYKYELLGECNVVEPKGISAPISLTTKEPIIAEDAGVLQYSHTSPEDFVSIIQQHEVDYIIIDFSDDLLKEGYGHLFSDGISTGHEWDTKLYRVTGSEVPYEFVTTLLSPV